LIREINIFKVDEFYGTDMLQFIKALKENMMIGLPVLYAKVFETVTTNLFINNATLDDVRALKKILDDNFKDLIIKIEGESN